MDKPNYKKYLILLLSLALILTSGFIYSNEPINDDELYSVVHGNRLLNNPGTIGTDIFNFDQPFLGKLTLAIITLPNQEQKDMASSLNQFDQGEVQGKEKIFENQVKLGRIWNTLFWALTILLLFFLTKNNYPSIIISLFVITTPRLSMYYLEPILTLSTVIAIHFYYKHKNQIGLHLFFALFLGLLKHWYWIFYQAYIFIKNNNPFSFVFSFVSVFTLILFLNFLPFLSYLFLRTSTDVLTYSNDPINFLTNIRYLTPLIPYLGDFHASH